MAYFLVFAFFFSFSLRESEEGVEYSQNMSIR